MQTQINWSYRDREGMMMPDGSCMPYCVYCYIKSHEAKKHCLKRDLENSAERLVQRAMLLIEAMPKEKGSKLLDPYENCDPSIPFAERNRQHRIQCASHYSVGIVLMAFDSECREAVRRMIAKQGLPGPVTAELMGGVDYGSFEWKIAAKYWGNSADLYTFKLRARKEGGKVLTKRESEFFEGDEKSVEDKIKEFFG